MAGAIVLPSTACPFKGLVCGSSLVWVSRAFADPREWLVNCLNPDYTDYTDFTDYVSLCQKGAKHSHGWECRPQEFKRECLAPTLVRSVRRIAGFFGGGYVYARLVGCGRRVGIGREQESSTL